MLCVACGGEVPVGSRFCPRCGRATPTAEEAAAGGDTAPSAPPPGPPTIPPPPPPPPPPSFGAGGGAYGAPPGGAGAPGGGYGAYPPPPAGYPPPPGGYPGTYPPPPYGATAGGPVTYGLASFGQRVGGFLIDGFIQWAIVIVGFIIAAITAPEATFDNPDPGPGGLGTLVMMVFWLASVAYPIYFEGRPDGQTPGKKAVGIRVVRKDNGAPLGYGLAAGRFLARIVNWFTLGFGLLWAAWDPQVQAFHDKIAGTLVVRSSVYPPPGATPGGGYQQPAPV